MPCINRRLRDLCNRADCRLWEKPTLPLQAASFNDEQPQALHLAAQQALEWLIIKRTQLTDVDVSMQV